VSDKDVWKRFNQCGNLDICPICGKKKILEERREAAMDRRESSETPVLHK